VTRASIATWVLGAAGLALLGCDDFVTIGVLPAPGPDAAVVVDADADARASAMPEASSPGGTVTVAQCLASLDAGSAASAPVTGDAGAIGWLYPYPGTVFPGGFAAPQVMWSGPGGDAVLLRLHSDAYDYAACLVPAVPGRVAFPQAAWSAAQAATTGASDPFTLELTVLSGGQALGPLRQPVIIAAGSLDVWVYYMTIGSNLPVAAGNILDTGMGSTLRVRPGGAAEVVLPSNAGCHGCHSLSADGSRLVEYMSGNGASYALAPGSGSAPPPVASLLANPAPGAEFAGVVPDGTLYLGSARPQSVGPRAYQASPSSTAILYATATGQAIQATSIPTGAMTPAFSADSTLLAFNDYALGSGHGLALMDFSEPARAAANYRTLLTESSQYPAWPSFMPDDGALVFSLGDAADFSGAATGVSGILTPGPRTDLYIVDAKTRATSLLASAMGFASADDAASGITYLPFGSADLHQNYYPSVAPEASGGYAWVFFDSRRNYGNLGLLRGIWVAAIDLATGDGYPADPSHPAFYLPGQETTTGNFRAVAVRPPPAGASTNP
jgi:hypothetical protein